MTLYDRIEITTDNLSQILRMPRSQISFDVEMLVLDSQEVLCDVLAALQDYKIKPTKSNRNKLMRKLFTGKHRPKAKLSVDLKKKIRHRPNGIRSYVMTEAVLKAIITNRGKRPKCFICDKLIEVGDRVLYNKGRPYRHKECYDNSFIDVED